MEEEGVDGRNREGRGGNEEEHNDKKSQIFFTNFDLWYSL